MPCRFRARRLQAAVLTVLSLDAQPRRTLITAAQASQQETLLKSNPGNLDARGALLDYYFLARIAPAEAIPARRRHILWLIENAPAEPLAGGPPATIDASGHHLADPEGFGQASAAWRRQTAKPGASAAVLMNAAYFFKLPDRNLAMQLLERALALEPENKETGARLGDQYALSILGVTMVNRSGFPLAADSNLAQSPGAMQARQSLQTSKNPYVLAKAGYMLAWQGGILFRTGKLGFDPLPLAEGVLDRAVRLVPGERDVAAYRDRARELWRK